MANIYDQNVKLQAIADAITNQSITITTGQDLLDALADIANAMQPAAANISYDNTNSGLQAVNVQQAVDENADNISTLNSSITVKMISFQGSLQTIPAASTSSISAEYTPISGYTAIGVKYIDTGNTGLQLESFMISSSQVTSRIRNPFTSERSAQLKGTLFAIKTSLIS